MDDRQKKAAAAAAMAAVISASGAAVEASFDDPADLLQSTAVDPKIEYVNADEDDSDGAMQEEKKETEKRQGAAGVFREWILGLPLYVRAVFILPQWFIGNLVIAAGSFLFAGLSPILNWALGFVLIALVIAAAFTVSVKAMFPDLPLRKIINRHSVKWILIASAAVFLADLVLGVFWPGYARFKTLFMAAFTLAALGMTVMWFARREHRRRLHEMEETLAEEAEEAEPAEYEYTSLGQTFTVRPSKD